MRSIKEIFAIGHGPSSSHTMGPSKAALYIVEKYKKENIKFIKVTIYGSLALTGKGHLTDYIIDLKLKDIPHEIVFDTVKEVSHPNTMSFETTLNSGEIFTDKIVSIGGGTIEINDEMDASLKRDIYPHHYMKDILHYCEENNLTLSQYVLKFEDKDILDYLDKCYMAMEEATNRGISTEGLLPGPLHVQRKAPIMYKRFLEADEKQKLNVNLAIAIAAFANAEENASGGEIVIAPTCGSCGVIPGVIAYLKMRQYTKQDIINGLLVAGLIGILCKTNASVSGAEAGCQAEIGVACSMAASLIASVRGMYNSKIVQCAEIALEHSLGLTCDPVLGYVQIPCIERCAMFALKARNAYSLAKLIPSSTNIISFDDSVKTMYQTGKDLQAGYRETAEKGLADLIK